MKITRIYQAGVIHAAWKKADGSNASSPIEALRDTHALFQDAVNYHLVALAGMACRQKASDAEKSIGQQFREELCSIWKEQPKGNPDAETLQASVCRTLGRPLSMEFDEAVDVLFAGCERPELLPYVQQYLIDKVGKGDSVIQQEGRSLLPKLCDSGFSGNFDRSPVQMKAAQGLERVQKAVSRETIDETEVKKLAAEMDLSWVGIKTQVNSEQTESLCYTSAETKQRVSEILSDLENKEKHHEGWKSIFEAEGVDFSDCLKEFRHQWENRSEWRLLAKNNKTSIPLRNAAVLFQYFPCCLTAKMLSACLKRSDSSSSRIESKKYDYRELPYDALMVARGSRGYVYSGFSALPSWGSQKGGEMREKQWDILAFKEALKCLHGFELKMQEREKERAEVQSIVDYMEGKAEKAPKQDTEGDEGELPVLGGDPRYECLQELLEGFRGEEYEEYSLFGRALKGWKDLKEAWKKKNSSEESVLREEVESRQKKLGTSELFLKLCEKDYQWIWRKEENRNAKGRGKSVKRSEDILSDFAVLQKHKWKLERLKERVRVSAADPVYSPRALNCSEWSGNELFKSKISGKIDLPVLVRNDKGHWEKSFVRAAYAAPRMVRDELGVNPGKWDSKDSCTWLQPMMAALGVESRVVPEKTPAVFLAFGTKEKPDGCPVLLNFPVQLDVEDLQKKLGQRDRWKGQFISKEPEKFYLLWPGMKKEAGKGMPWWEREEIRENGFSCLGIDLGVRTGSSYSVVEVRAGETDQMESPSGRVYTGRFLGRAGGRVWHGFPVKQGVSRLAGEGGKCGSARKASKEEIRLVDDLRKEIGEGRGRDEEGGGTILDRQNSLLWSVECYLKRFRTYARCINLLQEEDDVWEEVKKQMQEKELVGWKAALSRRDKEQCLSILSRELSVMKRKMPRFAERTMNDVVLPRKKGQWRWLPLDGKHQIGGGRMELTKADETLRPEKKIFFQGGLSSSRISVLERLRRVLQSMSRLLADAGNGKEVSRIPIEDACPILLEKINRMREQRVNQIAHDIVAQALGVRLKEEKSQEKKDRRIYHGEYEKIPGRRPVDFVVLENLARYKTNVDRPREENSRLMQWSHRQIVLKIRQMLEEVFGIPVILTYASYTSKFDCMTSAPGFRPQEMTGERVKKMAVSGESGERTMAEKYARMWTTLQEKFRNKAPESLRKTLKLFMPHPSNGGEYFVSAFQGKIFVRHADINAAVNIAWRGLASHETLELLHRVRLKKEGSKLKLRKENAREKALQLKPEELKIGEGDASAAFYSPKEGIQPLVQMNPASRGRSFTFEDPGKLWGCLKNQHWNLCHQLNVQALRKHLGEQAVNDMIERFFGHGR